MSLVESLTSTLIGYTVATAANYYILPLFGHKVTLADASWIGVIFTVISLIRGYFVRRMFNYFWIRHIEKKYGISATGVRTATELMNKVRMKQISSSRLDD